MARPEDRHFWFCGRQAFVGAVLDRLGQGDVSILDVGCGTGGMTSFLGRWGTVIGVEPSPLARRLCRRRGVRVVAASAEKLPFRANSFDLVTPFDVLYHRNVNEPRALREAYRVLKPGGMLVVTDCAIPWLWSKHDEAMCAKRRYWRRELTALVAAAGFEMYQSSYMFMTTFPLFVLSRLRGKETREIRKCLWRGEPEAAVGEFGALLGGLKTREVLGLGFVLDDQHLRQAVINEPFANEHIINPNMGKRPPVKITIRMIFFDTDQLSIDEVAVGFICERTPTFVELRGVNTHIPDALAALELYRVAV